jgi:hypothetical protein
MTPIDAAQPPRLATWIVTLFAPTKEAEAIVGDLHEEFTSLVGREGARTARWWYWRHSVWTVGHLAVGPFRTKPWPTIGIGVAGLLSSFVIGSMMNVGALAIVVRYPVYDYIPAALFWQLSGMLPLVVTGFVAARLARNQPMTAVLSILFAMAVWNVLDTPVMVLLYGYPRGVHITFASSVIRWLYGMSTFGGLVVLGAVAGRLMGRRDHRRASA